MMKNDEETKSKEELEAELLKVRSEIQWREREKEATKEATHRYFAAFISLVFLFPILYLFEEVMGFIIWIIVLVILVIVFENNFNKTKEGKRVQKATQELEELKKQKTELEKKLDSLEDLEEAKKHKSK